MSIKTRKEESFFRHAEGYIPLLYSHPMLFKYYAAESNNFYTDKWSFPWQLYGWFSSSFDADK